MTLDPKILRLVAITDDAEDRRATLVDRVAAAVRGGATSIQVRLKLAPPREVVEITRSALRRSQLRHFRSFAAIFSMQTISKSR